ncbi:MAG: type II secretion system F family protein [Methanobrevibacter sp.]|nr:type II secretion system F family protein [Methanobrevibacter sp.]
MVIIIFDEFFIQFSDLLIKAFLKIIDFIITFMNKFGNGGKNDEIGYSKTENQAGNKINFNKEDVFKIGDFLKNDSIFEELENMYSNNSSSNLYNRSNQSQNIFSSLKKKNHEGIGSNDSKLFGSPSNENKLIGNNLNESSNFIENIKEKIVYFLLNNQFVEINESNIYGYVLRIIIILFSILTAITGLVSIFVSLELGMAILISFLLLAFGIFYYPKIKKQNEYSSFSKELPYALRQLATELRSGKSLFDSMGSIVNSDYGLLSLEFSRVLEEIKYGESTETAFLNLEKRVGSPALSRVIYEILTSLRIGANLSTSLTIIAEDVNFDIRMKLKEYSEKLNAFIMIYTFLAILAPVILLTMLLAASVVIGDLVPGDLILILYSVFFPMIIVFLGFAIKKLEPKV